MLHRLCCRSRRSGTPAPLQGAQPPMPEVPIGGSKKKEYGSPDVVIPVPADDSKVIADYNTEIKRLQGMITQLEDQRADLQGKYDKLHHQHVALHRAHEYAPTLHAAQLEEQQKRYEADKKRLAADCNAQVNAAKQEIDKLKAELSDTQNKLTEFRSFLGLEDATVRDFMPYNEFLVAFNGFVQRSGEGRLDEITDGSAGEVLLDLHEMDAGGGNVDTHAYTVAVNLLCACAVYEAKLAVVNQKLAIAKAFKADEGVAMAAEMFDDKITDVWWRARCKRNFKGVFNFEAVGAAALARWLEILPFREVKAAFSDPTNSRAITAAQRMAAGVALLSCWCDVSNCGVQLVVPLIHSASSFRAVHLPADDSLAREPYALVGLATAYRPKVDGVYMLGIVLQSSGVDPSSTFTPTFDSCLLHPSDLSIPISREAKTCIIPGCATEHWFTAAGDDASKE